MRAKLPGPFGLKKRKLGMNGCSYKAYLEEEKKRKAEKEKAASMLEEERKAELLEKDVRKKDYHDNRKQIKSHDGQKKELQSSADALLKEGNDRLKEAIKESNTVKIRIAQSILEAAEKTRNDQEESTNKINRIIHKRKTTLIDMLTKPPKKD